MTAKRLRIIFWSLVAIGLVAALVYALQPQSVLVDMVEVQRQELRVSVIDDGVTRIRERYVVSSPLAGRLTRISFDEGDSVVAGKTILTTLQATDPDLLDPRAVAQAQARVSAAERRLEVAKAEQAQAAAALSFAEQEVGRLRRLADSRAGSVSELDEAEYLFRSRAEQERAAAFNVDIAEYELQQQRAALLLTAPPAAAANESSIEPVSMELPVLAPITGRVLRVHQESSTIVTPGTPLLEIGDPTDLEVVVDVLSQDAVRIQPGNEVILKNWGRGEQLTGRVRRVEPSGFTKVSALGVEEQRVNIIVDFLSPPEARPMLGDGFRVEARIVVWESEQVTKVPTAALFRTQRGWAVFVVERGIARQRPLEIGHANALEAEVTQGLVEGEIVLLHPSDKISEGTRVQNRS